MNKKASKSGSRPDSRGGQGFSSASSTTTSSPAAADASSFSGDSVFGRCIAVDRYKKLNRIGEGTYGTVYRAEDTETGNMVALKKVIVHNEGHDGFPITSLREIQLLRRLRHPNIVGLRVRVECSVANAVESLPNLRHFCGVVALVIVRDSRLVVLPPTACSPEKATILL